MRTIRWILAFCCALVAVMSLFMTTGFLLLLLFGDSPHPNIELVGVSYLEALIVEGAVVLFGFLGSVMAAGLAVSVAPPDDESDYGADVTDSAT